MRKTKKKNKINTNEVEFLKYQDHAYNVLEQLINDGWDRFKFDQPPEFILTMSFLNSVLTHPNLGREGKNAWLKGIKNIIKDLPDDSEDAYKKMFPENNEDTIKTLKKSVLN